MICEELLPEDLNDGLKSLIIQALTRNICLEPGLEITTELAVNAFIHALPYASQNFKVEHERNYIMDRLFDGFKVQDEDVRVIAMQTLVELGKQEYEYIEFYFSRICEVTSHCAKNDDEKVGAQGIEFWTSLAEEELSKLKKGLPCKNYIHQCYKELTDLLIVCI